MSTRVLVADHQDPMPEQATAHDDTVEAGPVPDGGFSVLARLPLAEVPA
ncbi:hypothetical protein [Actinokineospora cianjurensis]|uniref:Uncharacterized protein n=1 Tax=Actinokineospora cianjurensis TaxID=585224 RepID=A0A421BCB7_9PSEU|nr:hypothetical protein [Actinokineospora cianjurensis]RLK61987.1 hypothetical protein CLV68_2537 [Actinokineospora cianjurensis]